MSDNRIQCPFCSGELIVEDDEYLSFYCNGDKDCVLHEETPSYIPEPNSVEKLKAALRRRHKEASGE